MRRNRGDGQKRAVSSGVAVLVIAGFLAWSGSPLVTAAAGPGEAANADVPPGDVDAGYEAGEEVVALRTEDSKTFATEQAGQLKTRVWEEPVHYAAEGAASRAEDPPRWKDIDAQLTATGNGRFVNGANSFRLSLAGAENDGTLATLDLGGNRKISFGMADAARVRGDVVSGSARSTVRYRGVQHDVELRLSSTPTGVKEDIILRSAKAPGSFLFPLQLSGVSATLDAETGAIIYHDAAGDQVAAVPAGWMEDAKGQFGDVSYELVDHAGQPAIRVKLDRAWLAKPDRAFPVVVDPTHTTRPFLYDDTLVRAAAPTTNYSSHPNLLVGASGSEKYRSFMHFGGGWRGGILPVDGHHAITSARLSLYNVSSSRCVRTNGTSMTSKAIQLKRVTQSWTNSVVWPGPAYDAATWGWSDQSLGFGDCAAGWIRISMTDLAKAWYAETFPNRGLAVLASHSWSDTHRRFASNDNTHPSQRPFLEVSWTNAAPSIPTALRPSNGGIERSVPQLAASYSDPDGDWGSIRFTVERMNNSGTWSTVVADQRSAALTGSKGTATYTLPANLPAGHYRWRARSDDYYALSGWSAYSEFRYASAALRTVWDATDVLDHTAQDLPMSALSQPIPLPQPGTETMSTTPTLQLGTSFAEGVKVTTYKGDVVHFTRPTATAAASHTGISGLTVYPADADDAGVDQVVQVMDGGGVRLMSVLTSGAAAEAHRSHNIVLPAGATIAANGADLVMRTSAGGEIGTVTRPLAVDASKKPLPSSLHVQAGRIVQRVDLTGATFPVVSGYVVVPLDVPIQQEAAPAPPAAGPIETIRMKGTARNPFGGSLAGINLQLMVNQHLTAEEAEAGAPMRFQNFGEATTDSNGYYDFTVPVTALPADLVAPDGLVRGRLVSMNTTVDNFIYEPMEVDVTPEPGEYDPAASEVAYSMAAMSSGTASAEDEPVVVASNSELTVSAVVAPNEFLPDDASSSVEYTPEPEPEPGTMTALDAWIPAQPLCKDWEWGEWEVVRNSRYRKSVSLGRMRTLSHVTITIGKFNGQNHLSEEFMTLGANYGGLAGTGTVGQSSSINTSVDWTVPVPPNFNGTVREDYLWEKRRVRCYDRRIGKQGNTRLPGAEQHYKIRPTTQVELIQNGNGDPFTCKPRYRTEHPRNMTLNMSQGRWRTTSSAVSLNGVLGGGTFKVANTRSYTTTSNNRLSVKGRPPAGQVFFLCGNDNFADQARYFMEVK